MENTVKISQVDKIQRIYRQIQQLDKECIQLEKLGAEVSTDKCEIKFNLEVHNLTKDPKNRVKFDEDGSIVNGDTNSYGLRLYSMMMRSYAQKEEKESNSETISSIFSDVECLLIIGALLKIRYESREKLINQLKEIGVKL